MPKNSSQFPNLQLRPKTAPSGNRTTALIHRLEPRHARLPSPYLRRAPQATPASQLSLPNKMARFTPQQAADTLIRAIVNKMIPCSSTKGTSHLWEAQSKPARPICRRSRRARFLGIARPAPTTSTGAAHARLPSPPCAKPPPSNSRRTTPIPIKSARSTPQQEARAFVLAIVNEMILRPSTEGISCAVLEMQMQPDPHQPRQVHPTARS